MFAVQGGRDIAFLHAADDLDFLYDFAVAQDLKAGPLNHKNYLAVFKTSFRSKPPLPRIK